MRVSANARKEQLIDATILVMRRDGVQSVTLRAVAAEANASLAAVHYCFADKDDLLHAAVERWLKNMIDESLQVPTGHGLRDSVMRLAKHYWLSLEEAPDDILAQLELVLWASRNGDSKPLAGTIYPRYEKELAGLFANALHAAGETCEWELEAVGRALLVIIDGCSMQYLSQPGLPRHRTLYFNLIDALLDSIGIAQRAMQASRV